MKSQKKVSISFLTFPLFIGGIFFFSFIDTYFETKYASQFSSDTNDSILFVQGISLLSLSTISIPPAGYVIKEVYSLDVTGYSSTYDQTDADPYINAANRNVRWGTVATNFPNREEALSFGTKVRIPELFAAQVFVVEDRMNKRFVYRMDIWFPSTYQAFEFGVHRNIAVEVLEEI